MPFSAILRDPSLGILLNRLGSAVQAHEALWDTCVHCDTSQVGTPKHSSA